MRSHWNRVTLNPMWLISLWEETQTRGQRPCDIRGRDHSAAAGSQGTQGRSVNTTSWKEGFSPGAFRDSMALPAPESGIYSLQNRKKINFCCFVTQFAVLCYSSSRNWYPILSPHFCLLSFTKTSNCFCCRPSSDHQRNLLTPTSGHIALLLWTIQGFHPTSRLAAHCSETSSLHAPLLTVLRHTHCPAVPLTCQVSSFLRTSCLRLSPPGVAWPPPSCHPDPMRHQLLKETASMSPSLSHPSP